MTSYGGITRIRLYRPFCKMQEVSEEFPTHKKKKAIPGLRPSTASFSCSNSLQFPHTGGADILSFVGDNALGVIAEHTGRCILFQHNGFSVHIDLQRILLSNIQRPAKLNGQNDPSQFVHFSDDTGRFQLTHILPAQRTPAMFVFLSNYTGL